MTRLPDRVERYLGRRGADGPWSLAGADNRRVRTTVVIPALAEGASLLMTLRSLAANPAARDDALVIVVVNQGPDVTPEVAGQNREDLRALSRFRAETGLRLAWVDAASPGRRLPLRHAGVGLARKIGLDLALPHLDWDRDPLLVCLDADTLVAPDYLEAVVTHFDRSRAGGAVLPFRHQPAPDRVGQAAIDRYELFLRSYVLGLAGAGSPYAYHSVGSAMACRGEAYLRVGGMNRRRAAEDFYFLQQLAKTDGVEQLDGTVVYPSPRVSARVPFGTGRSMMQQRVDGPDALRFYPLEAYRILADWLTAAEVQTEAEATTLLRTAEGISPTLGRFLAEAGWESVWAKLQEHHPEPAGRRQAFHRWFDGLKTMRLIHALCAERFPRQPPEWALPELFAWCGLVCSPDIPEMLEASRRIQSAAQDRSPAPSGWNGPV